MDIVETMTMLCMIILIFEKFAREQSLQDMANDQLSGHFVFGFQMINYLGKIKAVNQPYKNQRSELF